MKNALIIIDMQYDFCEGGIIPYQKSLDIIPIINRIRDNYDFIIFIKDHHPENHCSFKEYGGIFPKHCIENSYGCRLHDDLILKNDDLIISRGSLQKYDSNSAFYDAEEINKNTKLKNFLIIWKKALY